MGNVMKKYLLVVLVSISQLCYSQKDSIGINVGITTLGHGPYIDSTCSIMIMDNGRDSGKIEITGDTLKIIRFLLDKIDEMGERESDLWKFIWAGVEFSNTVPDYYRNKKTNKAWALYLAQLRKHGYKTITR
jgi:hypothetical protein